MSVVQSCVAVLWLLSVWVGSGKTGETSSDGVYVSAGRRGRDGLRLFDGEQPRRSYIGYHAARDSQTPEKTTRRGRS